MARAVELIERDLTALQEALKLLTEEFQKTYDQYLTSLGQAIRQQLIQASYHLCTQGYPQPFLSLSFNHRQQLQQSIRQIAQKATEQLLLLIQKQNLEIIPSLDIQPDEDEESTPQSQLSIDVDDINSPDNLAQWQDNLEKAIAQTIAHLSRDTNRLLQEADILPRKLPEAILEVAGKAEAAGEMMTGPPNLLNLLIEAENSEDSELPGMTHIIAINLRLSEIEFTDSTSMMGRNQIRNLLVRLNALRRDYHKKQRERTIANAEAAWRASWFED